MAFVKTADEVKQISAVLQAPRFTDARRGYLTFRSEPDFIAEVLPPGLEPGAEPLITVTVGQFGSNCVGDFLGATISIAARHGQTDGAYVLTMFMSTDHAIIFGRDLFGEPKKHAEISLNMIGNQFRGTVDRLGVRLVDLSISLGDDTGPARSQANCFNIKAQPAANGMGLEADAVITLAAFTNDLSVNRAGQGTLILGGGIHDPLTDIPINEIVAAGYVEGDLSASVSVIDTIPAAAFLPYAYGRLDHWPALDTSARKATAAE
jgi:acetoacetate decarboxylase